MLSKTSYNLFSGQGSRIKAFFVLKNSGGINYASRPIFKAFSIILGIALPTKDKQVPGMDLY